MYLPSFTAEASLNEYNHHYRINWNNKSRVLSEGANLQSLVQYISSFASPRGPLLRILPRPPRDRPRGICRHHFRPVAARL